jgi:hypothetical protein
MDKENVAYVYIQNGIFLAIKELNSIICDKLDGIGDHYLKSNKPVPEK